MSAIPPDELIPVTPAVRRGDLPDRLHWRWVGRNYGPREDRFDAGTVEELIVAGLDALIDSRLSHRRRWHDGGSRQDVTWYGALELQVEGPTPGVWMAVGGAGHIQRRSDRATGADTTYPSDAALDDRAALVASADDLLRRGLALYAHARNLDGLAGKVARVVRGEP